MSDSKASPASAETSAPFTMPCPRGCGAVVRPLYAHGSGPWTGALVLAATNESHDVCSEPAAPAVPASPARETPEIQPWRELRARKPAIPYLLYYPAIREAARSCGYALAIHGSLARDFDLIAVAWTPDATDADALVRAICDATEWMVTVPPKPGEKPHGRLGYTLMATGTKTLRGAWIDLSVIPPRPTPETGATV